jgi:hypothetical protein
LFVCAITNALLLPHVRHCNASALESAIWKPSLPGKPPTRARSDPRIPLKTGKNSSSYERVISSVTRFLKEFWELELHDKIGMILAFLLGAFLVLALSPILLVSWLCLFAKRRFQDASPHDR